MANVFEYVAIEGKENGDGWVEEIIADGKVIAYDEDRARLKIGALLGSKLHAEVQVLVRPF